MKICEILNQDKVSLSFEVFPPKNEENYQIVSEKAKEVAALKPDFMSVTYGAGGGHSYYTREIAKEIKQKYNVEVIAHLTCLTSTKESVKETLEALKQDKIENILALRGDIPKIHVASDYQHAIDLIKDIKTYGDFCIGAACYPEGHVEAYNKRKDLYYLKEKVNAGVDFLTTQMFFDNDIFYNFLYRLREQDITIPVIAGIMPITKKNQIKRAVQLSGSSVPQNFINLVDTFGDNDQALAQAGIIYASSQIIDLIANGIKHIHVYTMNNKEVAKGIMDNISELIK